MSSGHDFCDPHFYPWPDDLAESYRTAGYWQSQSLFEIVSSGAIAFRDRTAIVCGERRITYAQLERLASALARGLYRLGLRSGDRVVVQMPNILEAVQTYFALFRLGAIPIFALPGHRHAELSYFVRHAEAKAYIAAGSLRDRDVGERARTLKSEPDSSLRHVILLGNCDEFVSFEELRDSGDVSGSFGEDVTHAGLPDLEPIHASQVALLQLSGGSTGTPKLIPRTHDDYAYSVRRSAEICELDTSTVYLVALPLAHNFPMSSPGILGCLHRGGTVVLTDDPSPDTVFALFVRENVSMVAAVPPLAMTWLEVAKARQLRFEGLLLQVGGAKLSVEHAEALLDGLGCRLQQVFGMAEGLVCYTPLSAPREEIVSTQGYPMSPADEVRVVDDDDRELHGQAAGHLLTRGPYTIRGYFRAASHNRAAFTPDGFYRTGDIVSRTEKGALVVVGRAKEQINRGGEKIAPAELERCLASHPDVRAVAVVGVPDSDMGERICAFVVQASTARLGRSHLIAHLRKSGVATFKLPDHFEFVTELPRTSVGKIDKTKLLLVPKQEPKREVPSGGDLLTLVAGLIQVDPRAIDPTSNLLDFGLDSLHLMMLVESLRARGIEVSFVELAENPTVESFERLVNKT